MDYCDVFDGTHSQQSIHRGASDVMIHFSKSVPIKKQTHLGWLDSEYICFFLQFFIIVCTILLRFLYNKMCFILLTFLR